MPKIIIPQSEIIVNNKIKFNHTFDFLETLYNLTCPYTFVNKFQHETDYAFLKKRAKNEISIIDKLPLSHGKPIFRDIFRSGIFLYLFSSFFCR